MSLFGRQARRERHERSERRGTPFTALIVGLGNPGRQYSGTRHNVGFDAIELLAKRYNVVLKAGKERSLTAEVDHGDEHLLLAMPTTYMNESGNAVGPIARKYGITDPAKIIIVHDELDLEPGIVRIKIGGGLAGHNGLRSIHQHLKTQDFVRVRIGVGKPSTKEDGADHVLSKVSGAQRQTLDISVQIAADAVQLICTQGAEAAMQSINAK
jgi:PTH1 family peptidyl-tRNA hydrolase